MSVKQSDEHHDCLNWAHWARACDPHLTYPHRWSVPEGERQETTEAAERPFYDLNRALATDAIFTLWLRRYWAMGDYRSKAHFRILRASYLLGHRVGELDVMEALRALKDEKERACEKAKEQAARGALKSQVSADASGRSSPGLRSAAS